MGVLIEAVSIVLVVSFVSLGLHFKPGSWKFTIDWRPGMVAGITIPLVLAITFVTMYYWGVGLHKISLGSLIIALGLLVDDAIMGGLVVATVLMLLALPAMYAAWFRVKPPSDDRLARAS